MSALLSAVPHRPTRVLDRAELSAIVVDLARDRDAWQPLVRHLPERRWWTRLVSDSAVDAWLISWPGREGTDLHDHGASAAALTVVEGTLEHVLAARSGELSREALAPATLLTVEPWAVHDVGNPRGTPAVSIHAYSPPLEQMTFYRRHSGG